MITARRRDVHSISNYYYYYQVFSFCYYYAAASSVQGDESNLTHPHTLNSLGHRRREGKLPQNKNQTNERNQLLGIRLLEEDEVEVGLVVDGLI